MMVKPFRFFDRSVDMKGRTIDPCSLTSHVMSVTSHVMSVTSHVMSGGQSCDGQDMVAYKLWLGSNRVPATCTCLYLGNCLISNHSSSDDYIVIETCKCSVLCLVSWVQHDTMCAKLLSSYACVNMCDHPPPQPTSPTTWI